MNQKRTVFDLPYFKSREDAEDILTFIVDDKHPLILPEYDTVQKVTKDLLEHTNARSLNERAVLLAYQKLRQSHSTTDVFCGWKDDTGKICGGEMNIEVDAAGAYYRCKLNSNHRTPK